MSRATLAWIDVGNLHLRVPCPAACPQPCVGAGTSWNLDNAERDLASASCAPASILPSPASLFLCSFKLQLLHQQQCWNTLSRGLAPAYDAPASIPYPNARHAF